MNSYRSPSQPSPPPNGQSLATELQQTSPNTHQKQEPPPTLPEEDNEEGSSPSDNEEAWVGYQDTEGTSLTDEMMESILNTPMRAEVEMLQREKEMWREEQEKLQQTMSEVRADRDSVERWVWFTGAHCITYTLLMNCSFCCQLLKKIFIFYSDIFA